MKIKVADIIVERNARQRSEIGDVTDLAESIKKLGLINPIIITTTGSIHKLVAGERRLEAHKLLGWDTIEATSRADLSPTQLYLLELDENIKRQDISWEDQAEAILKYHEILNGTIEATAEAVGLKPSWTAQNIRVARELRAGNPKVMAASGTTAASNIVDRLDERAQEAEMSTIDTDVLVSEPEMDLAPSATAPPLTTAPTGSVIYTPGIQPPIQTADFIKWLETYKGKPFNFIHCDFPYGINHDKSDQGKSEQWGTYKDTPEHYWTLCKALAENKDKLLYGSAHIMFWFSMNYYAETIALFEAAGFMVQPFPLVWHKTDGKGIVPDFKRGPRRVYETALLMSWGDRKILDVVDNTYGCPTSKTFHLSEKPEPMLKHFFRMFVDGYSEVLDPTAGSGNALIAAARLGAKRVVGLEIDKRMTDVANVHYRQERSKDLLAERLSGEQK